jgi:hypothetical protein
VVEELSRVYHAECLKCCECDHQITMESETEGCAGEPVDLSSSNPGSSFQVSFRMEAGENGRVSRGCARMVCSDHVGSDTERADAILSSHEHLGDHVYVYMLLTPPPPSPPPRFFSSNLTTHDNHRY